ncbi:MAG: trypsin-like serine protease [Planctomycetota bacterium]
MRNPLLFTVSLCVLILAGTGLAITNGTLDTTHDSVGAIIIDASGYDPFIVCSGTLIDDEDGVFLTAAHCSIAVNSWIAAGFFTIDDVYVCFDEDVWATGATWIPVSSLEAHPDYTGKRPLDYDVGVLILDPDDPDDLPAPATLAAEGYLDDLKDDGELKGGPKTVLFTVVGYGTQLAFPPPKVIPTDGKRRVTQTGYLALNKQHLTLLQNQAAGLGGTGYGDSGGPTFWTDGDGDEHLVAVTSWGDPKLVATGITQRVDIETAHEFVEDASD